MENIKPHTELLASIHEWCERSINGGTPKSYCVPRVFIASVVITSLIGPFVAINTTLWFSLGLYAAINLSALLFFSRWYAKHSKWEDYIFEALCEIEPLDKLAYNELQKDVAANGFSAERVMLWVRDEGRYSDRPLSEQEAPGLFVGESISAARSAFIERKVG